MYNSYASSTVSLRCKGSLSFSSNDYFHLLNDGFDRNFIPLSSSSSCCPCCANSIYRVPINPSFLSGLKQSTLIQWSASRRLILCGGEGYLYRSPIHDVRKKCYYGNSWSLKERNVGGRRGRWREGRFGCAVPEKRSKRHHLSDVDEAEAMLSLLTENISEECFGVRERNDSSSRRVKVEERANGGGGNCYRRKKKNVDSGLLESNSKCEFESVTIQSREEDCRRKSDRQKEDKESCLRSENCRLRKEGSSHSSYYSFSSLDELESDDKVRVEYDGFDEEPLSGYKRVPRGSGEATFNREVAEEVKRHIDVAEGHGAVLKQENTAVGSYATLSNFDSNWRKKSEKKLREESTEHTLSRKGSSQQQSELLEVHETSYGKVPDYHKQYDDREEKSTSAMNIEEGIRHQHSQTGHQVIDSKSRMKYKQNKQTPEIHGGDVEMTSSSQKRFGGKEGIEVVAVSLVQERRDEHFKTAGHAKGQDEYRRKSQQITDASDFQEINIRGTSTSERLSETRMKNREDNSTVVLNFVQDTEDQHRRAGQWATTRKSSQSTDISDTHAINIGNKSTIQNQSDTRMKQEDSSNFVFSSFPEEKEQHLQTRLKPIKRMESGRESLDVSNISMVHSTDTQKVNTSQKTSEKRMSSQEIYSSSVVKSVEGTRERHNLTDERVLPSESRKEDQVSAQALSFSEGMLKGTSSSQADLHLQPQGMVQQTGDKGDKRSSQAIVTAPPSQLVEREPSECIESDYGVSHTHSQVSSPAMQHEIYGGSRGGETYQTPLNFVSHEGALDSADRLQKSSMHFVGEFVEKVRHEISTSETQKEKKTSEMMLVSKGEKSQYGSGDSQAKKHESRHSSQSSGTKGPSDDMWDVTDPSIQGTPDAEIPEVTTTTGNAIAKRTGRSLWNIIGDIVRLRWARSETQSSTAKSGGRTSSNQSNSSETWFSGQEPDESNDENANKDKKNKPQEATSADLQQVGKISAQDQGEGSSSTSSTEKIRHVGMGTISSSSILESGSASKSTSVGSGEETVGWKEDGKKSEGISSETAIVESSPLAARQLRRSPIVIEISEAGKTDISGSGVMVQMEQPIDAGLLKAPGAEGKHVELKRRKLQRNDQVMKDRFDEWEEAYTLETEQRKTDEMFMREALLEAKKAADTWEVPVGAVLVQHGRIIARGCNLVEELRDSTAHAEMICIREASNLLRTWRLSETTLYVTLEPCPMCAGAILGARINTVVWGAPNKLLGADGSWIRLFPNGAEGAGLDPTDKSAAPVHPFHPKMTIRRGVLTSECADVMQQFFQLRRRQKNKPDPPSPPPSCLPISNRPSRLLTRIHGIFNIMFCL
ncbi:tRNA(adenine(34)) deaminase, chloroplastic [Cornus florida]|uniref:tRNA(adenine(34)) deaminase, chloroplastic n=1 Tax=Cornus florida TaxID=4283 RepID=UPI0028978CAF|nr:tRNA(adenine(34)) deaminase, chloroplastic [Cornus florida]